MVDQLRSSTPATNTAQILLPSEREDYLAGLSHFTQEAIVQERLERWISGYLSGNT